MEIVSKQIVFLKSQDNDSQKSAKGFENILLSHGYSVKHLKVLDFMYKNLEVLNEQLESPNDYSGLIFTSLRSIRGAKLSLNGQGLHESWRLKKNYVVGESSKQLAVDVLHLNCEGGEAGNAENLAEIIIQSKTEFNKPFLYPSGNLKRDTLENLLSAENIQLNSVEVYETIQNPNINADFSKLTKNNEKIPEYFIYFSPSSVKFTKELVEDLGLHRLIKLIAIGPSTASELRKYDWPVHNTAEKPTPEYILKAIQSV